MKPLLRLNKIVGKDSTIQGLIDEAKIQRWVAYIRSYA